LPEPEIKDPEPKWSGKQIFSLFLPKTLNYSLKANICQGCAKCEEEECKHDAYVVVRNGQLVSGIIDRRSIGAEQSESLLHRIIKDYGTQAGREFLNKITHMLKLFISMRGFSYTYDQLVLSPKAENRIKKTMERIQKKIDEHIENYRTAPYHVSQVKPWKNPLKSLSCTNSQQPETKQAKSQTMTLPWKTRALS
jgi:DNA-directed RNA polymerase subunit A'